MREDSSACLPISSALFSELSVELSLSLRWRTFIACTHIHKCISVHSPSSLLWVLRRWWWLILKDWNSLLLLLLLLLLLFITVWPATSNLQPATCNLQPATCNLQPANYTLRLYKWFRTLTCCGWVERRLENDSLPCIRNPPLLLRKASHVEIESFFFAVEDQATSSETHNQKISTEKEP